jgi:DNA sulfur modification protein DndD
MLLKKLVLKDVGTYAGQQEFDLSPKTKYGSKRPIILFGGLNGAGKTTFLTAVRLALYGRQSLDALPTQKEYEQYLLDLIHRPKHFLVRSTQASVMIEFEYARMGVRATYKVIRFWEEKGKGVAEQLIIYRDDGNEPYLVDEQAQAFLSQLVPPGVAQFFFFDGEKISALAKDDSDAVLADAIRRLLGLDLVDRLNSDLSVFTRSHRAAHGDKKLKDEKDYEVAELASRALGMQRTEAREALMSKKAELSSQGGAWSVNRSELELELANLRDERLTQEEVMREALNGVGIFKLSPKLVKRLCKTLATEGDKLEVEVVKAAVITRSEELKRLIGDSIKGSAKSNVINAVDEWIQGFSASSKDDAAVHRLSVADIRSVQTKLISECEMESFRIASAFAQASKAQEQEEKIQDQLAHAPSDESIRAAFEEMTAAAERVGELDTKWKSAVEEQRRLTWQSIELVRKLKKCEEKLVDAGNVDRGHAAADATQEFIAEFKVAAAKHKCGLLKQYFVQAFKRLARKDDIVRDALIDSETFRVTLLDGAGREVAKKRLSAGEKQIYSISMLEALAKTSGRNLPVIIDTPLGRLDSKHRNKLVESYFPVASHQVIVLSTDTEVDSKFYDALSNKISHAFHLSYDEESGSTLVEPGYFWRQNSEEILNVA